MKDFYHLVLQCWLLNACPLAEGVLPRVGLWNTLTTCEASYSECLSNPTPPDEPARNVTPLCCIDTRSKCCIVEDIGRIVIEQEHPIHTALNIPATCLHLNGTPETYRVKVALDGLVSDEIQRKSENIVFMLIICACALKCFTTFLPMRKRTTTKEPLPVKTFDASSMTSAVVQPIIDMPAGGDYIFEDKDKLSNPVATTNDDMTSDVITRPVTRKTVPRRLVRRLIKQNAYMRVRNYRDHRRITKYEQEITLKSNRNMELFMKVKEEMAKVINLDKELTRLDSDNTALADRLDNLKTNCQHKTHSRHTPIKDVIQRRKKTPTSGCSPREEIWRY